MIFVTIWHLFTYGCLCLIDCFSDIVAHIFVGKIHPLGCLISFLSRFLQIFSGCGDTKHPTAVCDDLGSLTLLFPPF